MAKRQSAQERKWDPPASGGGMGAQPDAHDDEYDAEGYYDPLGGARRERARPAAAAGLDTPPWDDEPDDHAPAEPPARGRGAKSGSGGKSGAATTGKRAGRNAPARDNRPTLTVAVSGDEGEQFDVLVDGKAYWGGEAPPYQFEMKLDSGEHALRVMQRHPIDRQPSGFMPLPLAILLGDGRKSEMGPYHAALDARLNLASDVRLNVKFSMTGGAGRRRAAFACSPGRGMEFEVMDTSMSSPPGLRRRWCAANYFTLLVMSVIALSVVGLGAYMAVRPGGTVGGGIVMAVLGTALAMGCAGIAGAVRTAQCGGYAPDIDMPQSPRRRSKPDKAAAAPGEAEPQPDRKPAKSRRKAPANRKTVQPQDYDGAYDDAGEMADFESSGLSTAELTPEQLRAAKKQLMRKLGGEEE